MGDCLLRLQEHIGTGGSVGVGLGARHAAGTME